MNRYKEIKKTKDLNKIIIAFKMRLLIDLPLLEFITINPATKADCVALLRFLLHFRRAKVPYVVEQTNSGRYIVWKKDETMSKIEQRSLNGESYLPTIEEKQRHGVIRWTQEETAENGDNMIKLFEDGVQYIDIAAQYHISTITAKKIMRNREAERG